MSKTKEEIAAELAAEEKAVADAKAEADLEASQEKEIDYKAEAEKLKNKNDQAGHNIEEERGKRLAAEAKAEKLEEEAKVLAETSGKSIEEAKGELRVEMDSIKSDLLKDVVSDELDLLTDNEEEKELIKLVYEQKIADKGTNRSTVREALENARILANKPRFQNAINEVDAANRSKNSLGKAGAANADNTNFKAADVEAEQIENEMGGDLPASFK